MKQLYLIPLLVLVASIFADAQSVTNVRFEPSGKQIVIYYDLSGDKGSSWNTAVYCSRDGGKTLGAPLQKITGDCGNAISTGTNKKVIWDVLAEYDKLEGEISFKVEATKNFEKAKGEVDNTLPALKYSADYYKYKKHKTIWMVSALTTACIGTFAYLQAGKYYSEYESATADADDLHAKADMYNKLAPMAFGLAAFCTVEFVLQSGKQKKAKGQKISFNPQPLFHGGGLGLAYHF